MRKLIFLCLFFFSAIISISTNDASKLSYEDEEKIVFLHSSCEIRELFEELGLQDEVSFQGFKQAVIGFGKVEVKKPILTLIDFSKASTEERFYVIDMENRKVLFKSHVAHGRNSGYNYATSFSNVRGSHQSSLGFFLTGRTYYGRHGLSLILHGLEKGINDNAKVRTIVIHGADYSDPRQIRYRGRLGRSLGCPALPHALTRPIINTIKDGSLLYVFSERHNEEYLRESTILRGVFNPQNSDVK